MSPRHGEETAKGTTTLNSVSLSLILSAAAAALRGVNSVPKYGAQSSSHLGAVTQNAEAAEKLARDALNFMIYRRSANEF